MGFEGITRAIAQRISKRGNALVGAGSLTPTNQTASAAIERAKKIAAQLRAQPKRAARAVNPEVANPGGEGAPTAILPVTGPAQ